MRWRDGKCSLAMLVIHRSSCRRQTKMTRAGMGRQAQPPRATGVTPRFGGLDSDHCVAIVTLCLQDGRWHVVPANVSEFSLDSSHRSLPGRSLVTAVLPVLIAERRIQRWGTPRFTRRLINADGT